ncbi:MAG: hypothetical protein WC565_03280 [Parcubacteria group bacterium]|jgi:hypothetical protein
MSELTFYEMLYTARAMLPDQDDASQMFNSARMMDAAAIFDKIINCEMLANTLDVVRHVTDDMTEDEIVDSLLEFGIDIYPGVAKEIEKDKHDSKLLIDVLTLCAKEIKNVPG